MPGSSCSSSRAGTAGPVPPLNAMTRSASDPAISSPAERERLPVKRSGLKKRAAEMVALSSLCSASSTGSLQHDHIRRLRTVLENVDEQQQQQYEQQVGGGLSAGSPPRSKEWLRPRLQHEKALSKHRPPLQEGQWRLRRGKWTFEEPPEPPREGSAAEALDLFMDQETARGRGPQYRNSICGPPGLMRRWQIRNPTGGFFDSN